MSVFKGGRTADPVPDNRPRNLDIMSGYDTFLMIILILSVVVCIILSVFS